MSDTPTPEPAQVPTPQPEATPATISITSTDGGWNPDYLSGLPDDLGSHSSFEKYKTPADYFKGSINSQKLNGQKAEDFWTSDDPDHIAKRQEIMGVPKESSEYEFNPVEWADGMPADVINAHYEQAKDKFKELGINKEQAKALIEWDAQTAIEQFNGTRDSYAEQIATAEKTLQAEWKGETYQYNIDKSKNALEHLGLADWIEDPAFANNPAFIKDVFEKIVPLISDDTIIEARQQQNAATLEDSYNLQYEKMLSLNPSDPSYQREVQKMKLITDKMN